jgi:hypothetical protein
LFFSGMAGVILASVFVGFAHSYYLAGVFKAPLPNLLIHIHGVGFSWPARVERCSSRLLKNRAEPAISVLV